MARVLSVLDAGALFSGSFVCDRVNENCSLLSYFVHLIRTENCYTVYQSCIWSNRKKEKKKYKISELRKKKKKKENVVKDFSLKYFIKELDIFRFRKARNKDPNGFLRGALNFFHIFSHNKRLFPHYHTIIFLLIYHFSLAKNCSPTAKKMNRINKKGIERLGKRELELISQEWL